MPSSPHLMCSMCDTNIDTSHDPLLQEGEVADDLKTWLIDCGHVVCNSCCISIFHVAKERFRCNHCQKYYSQAHLRPQLIYIRDTIPSIMGKLRGLQHEADRLLAERNKILREGSVLYDQFKELQAEVEKQDSILESMLASKHSGYADGMVTEENHAPIGGDRGGNEEWQY